MRFSVRFAVVVLLGGVAALSAAERSQQSERPRVPLLSNEEAWDHLPECPDGRDRPLPNWARALAQALPHTTAAMLELDHLYRTTAELDPK
ncbi:MAG TPA: hypothetical protein VML55_18345, partial [Planctomycetaceae bacterium]|nr:hypothetical protein [Planctomycetaceae bacterium]